MKIRRFLSIFLLTVLLATLTVPAYGLEDPAIRAKAALLVDISSDTVLYEKDIHDELDIASTTKIMSALLIFEALDRGDLRMDQSITATASALKGLPEDGSTADIVAGETLTVEQLLYCMLVISANETCNILGEALDGSVDAFVAHMNQRAQELGCKNTHFANTTGLTKSGHYSSAWDLYLITREAMTHDDFMTIVNTKSYEIPPTNKTEDERVRVGVLAGELLAVLGADAADARVGVLQVRAGVAFERERLLPRERDQRPRILAQVRVLHGADADLRGEGARFVFREVRTALVDDGHRAGLRLVEQRYRALLTGNTDLSRRCTYPCGTRVVE